MSTDQSEAWCWLMWMTRSFHLSAAVTKYVIRLGIGLHLTRLCTACDQPFEA